MTHAHNPTAREYLRVSLDRSGRERSIDEQHDDNLRMAERHGWTLADPYRDVGSASRYAAQDRGGYDQLVADLAADRFDADLLILWESSRGSRRVVEWVTLLETCEDRGVQIAVTTHDRTYHPANARDRRSLIDDANDAEYESAKVSARSKRAASASAAAGRPHGRVPYGYRRVYDQRTGQLVAQELEPLEASHVAEWYDRVRRGHSLRSIADDFDRRGVRTRSGTRWTPEHIRSTIIRRLYAGERIHGSEVYPAMWPALVPRETWRAVQGILTAPERRTRRPGRGVHLLSMTAVCDVCGGPLSARYNTSRPERGAEYRCHRGGHVRVSYDDLNGHVEDVVLDYLTRPDNVGQLADPGNSDALAQARQTVAEIGAELDDLADQVGAGTLSATLAARAEPAIRRRLQAAVDAEAELTTPRVLRDLIRPGAGVRRRWDAATMPARREILRLLLTPDVLGELRVARAPSPGHRGPVEDRTIWRQNDATDLRT